MRKLILTPLLLVWSFEGFAGKDGEKEDEIGPPLTTIGRKEDLIFSDQEISVLKKQAQETTEKIDELLVRLSGKEIPSWDNFIQGYRPVDVLNTVNFEEAIEDYRRRHPAIDSHDSFNYIMAAWEHSRKYDLALQYDEVMIDSIVSIISKQQIKKQLDEILDNNMMLLQGLPLSLLRDAEASFEATISRLTEKKKWINELRSKRLYLEMLESLL